MYDLKINIILLLLMSAIYHFHGLGIIYGFPFIICLVGCPQAHSAQGAAGSGGKKTQVDQHAAAESSQTVLRQVRYRELWQREVKAKNHWYILH